MAESVGLILIDNSGSISRHWTPEGYDSTKEGPSPIQKTIATLAKDEAKAMQAKGMKPIAIEFGSSARLLGDIPQDYIPAGLMGGTNPVAALGLAERELGLKKVNEVYLITDGAYDTKSFDNYCQSFCDDVEGVFVGMDGNAYDSYEEAPHSIYEAETKKQSRPVKPTANPQGVRFTYGTPIDLASLGEKLTIGNRLAAGKFKLEAHYPAKQFNNKTEYINKRKEGSYCRFYDNKSPYFIARTIWDADRMPGIHMKAKNKFGETFTFVVTPKLDDPTKVTILGGYVIPTVDGPVLCTGAIGELEAVGDDGDFKVVAYDKPNIRCPKSATGKVPTSMEYVKRPSKPRKTAADYCKPKHSFKHPTDIRAAEMVGEMADWIDEGTECYSCGWEGTIGELEIETDPEDATMPIMICPLCGEDEWLSDLFESEAGEYDEPCFSCDGMGADTEGKCGYCGGSGMMSETLKADLAAFDSEYFDAECGCWKGLESEDEDEEYYGEMYDAEAKKELSFMDWAKQEEASHLKKYGAEGIEEYEIGDDEQYKWLRGVSSEGFYFTIVNEGPVAMSGGSGYTPPYAIIHKNYSWDGPADIIIDLRKEGQDTWLAPCDECNGWRRFPDNWCMFCATGLDCCDCDEDEDDYDAEVLEAPLVGAGATMDIAKDTDLSSFTSKELTESSAISGDFDHASLNYSGNQNIAARAEEKSSIGFLFKSLVGISALAAGMYSAKKIIEIGDDE